MNNLLTSIDETLSALPTEFTTHEFIVQLAKNNQHAYIRALYENLDSDRPFQRLHSKIGKHLRQSPEIVTFIRANETDFDIFGQKSENALWKKNI